MYVYMRQGFILWRAECPQISRPNNPVSHCAVDLAGEHFTTTSLATVLNPELTQGK